VAHLVAVDEREDRAPEAHRELAGDGAGGNRRGEQRPGLLVVEQDSPFRIAEEHGLGQLGHESREAVALLPQARIRLRDPRLQVAVQGAVGIAQPVDRDGQLGGLGPSRRHRDTVIGVGRGHDEGLLREGAKGCHEPPEKPPQDAAATYEDDQRQEGEQRRTLLEDAAQHALVLLIEPRGDQAHDGGQQGRDRAEEHRQP
jgi:hypothetical protein